MGLAARLYSEDHQGKFPFDLTECVPTFIEASAFENLRFDSREKSNQPSRPKFDWLYFGAFFEERNPPPLLIASPQTFVAGATRKRIIVLGDLSASIVLEEKYQELLRKTIEAMRQRRGETKTE